MADRRWTCLVVVLAFILGLNTVADAAQQRRLIRLKVDGPALVEQAVETFLTTFEDPQFLLGDDDAIPLLFVQAREEIEGTALNSRVTYFIDRLKIVLPDGKVDHVSMGWSAYDYGEISQARQSALHLLLSYFRQDEKLTDALKKIPAQAYYEITKPGIDDSNALAKIKEEILARMKKELSGFSDEISDRIAAVEKPQPVSKGAVQPPADDRIPEMARLIEALARQVDSLARKLKDGTGVFSAAQMHRLQEPLNLLTRDREIPFVHNNDCPVPDEVDFNAVAGVAIFVPVDTKEQLGHGIHRIFAENQSLVYPSEEDRVGPKVAVSFDLLKKGPMADTFRSSKCHLKLTAKDYCPDDRAVILKHCDAVNLDRAGSQGNEKVRIFRDGLIFLIPMVRGDGGA